MNNTEKEIVKELYCNYGRTGDKSWLIKALQYENKNN